MKKLYIVSYGDGLQDGEGVYSLVSEDGKAWYSHFCSHLYYAQYDLVYSRPNRIKELNEYYGKENWSVVTLGEDEMTYDELLKRFKNLDNNEYKEVPRVSITYE